MTREQQAVVQQMRAEQSFDELEALYSRLFALGYQGEWTYQPGSKRGLWTGVPEDRWGPPPRGAAPEQTVAPAQSLQPGHAGTRPPPLPTTRSAPAPAPKPDPPPVFTEAERLERAGYVWVPERLETDGRRRPGAWVKATAFRV